MTSGKQARAERAAKIEAVTPKESRTKLIAGILVAILAVAGIGWAIAMGVQSSGSTAGKAPAGATGESGGIVVTPASALKQGAPTVDVYEDFQCPACQQQHTTLGPVLTQLSQSGQIKLVYHMKNFLEKQLTGLGATSSTAAANAAACAADAGTFLPYHSALFDLQPAREGDGYPDAALAKAAATAGITGGALDTWNKCVKDGTYKGYVQRVDEESAKAGINGTPTYLSNGKKIDFEALKISTVDQFRAALLTGGASTTLPGATPGTTPGAKPSASTAK